MTCSVPVSAARHKRQGRDSDIQLRQGSVSRLDKVRETRKVKDMVTSMIGRKEHITHEAGNNDAWVCTCGNRTDSHGFYPCNANGDEVEPTPGDWITGLYVCAQCGRNNSYGYLGDDGTEQRLQASFLGRNK